MPILRAGAFEIFSNSPEQTRRMGMQLGSRLQAGDLVCLEGELGSGKTTLTQGVAAGWGSAEAVTSPTFVLVNVYARPDGQQLAHLDAYRLNSAEDAQALDLDHLLAKGPMLVEWPGRIEPALPAERLWIKLFWIDEDRRRLEISPQGERYQAIASSLRDSVFGL
ncbi:MAG: tRNA (adenosine(37)-N6)-threonylcarbamoyltransferase complex ATPase subunit type 1 TsaE [Anaerolineales bacterium]|nr:tRNA (adenosine(37)-N6)-threonylcarbamoyltransferase complex ATPase subunit type 1 TsaE [Anaerolineales bacterium]